MQLSFGVRRTTDIIVPRLLAAYPISNEDLTALPVCALEAAITYYVKMLGFTLVRREAASAAVAWDAVQLGLVAQADHEPGRAGSVAIEADDLDSLHEELGRAGAGPGEFGVDEWDGRTHRTFFVRESGNGYCYCFFRPL